MRRLQYMLQKNQQRQYDSEDPDSRPISLLTQPQPQIVKPVMRSDENHIKRSMPAFHSKPKLADLPTFSPRENARSKTSFSNVVSAVSKRLNERHTGSTEHLEILDTDTSFSKEENSIVVEKYVRDFVLSKTQDVQAIVIQRAWRLYLKKVHWKRCIAMHIDYNKKLLRLHVLCWRLANVNSPQKLQELYSKFSKFYEFISYKFKKREMAPFRLFYVSGRIFLPDGYTPNTVYAFIYMMSAPMMHRILALWKYTARKKKEHRTTLTFIRFTTKKRSCYGKVFACFQMWERLTRFKKQLKIQETEKQSAFVELKESEVNVKWTIFERRSNIKKTRYGQARKYSRKRVCLKAIRALYNRAVEVVAKEQVIETSDRFRDYHLQTLAHRGWLKYMQIRAHEANTKRDFMNAWYKRVYEVKERDFLFDLSTEQYYSGKFIKVMNGWYRVARTHYLAVLRMQMKTQANPSMALAIIFLLKDNYELFFSTLCFRLWIRFIRARKRWRSFARWSGEPDEDRETAHLVLSEMKRACVLKLMRRMFVGERSFFPRKVGLSLELSLREIEEEKKRDQIEAKHHWRFETATERHEAAPKLTGQTLTRLMLVRLHQLKKYDTSHFDGVKPEEVECNPFFAKIRTYEELRDAVQGNIGLLRDRLTVKVARDQAVLAGMVSHIQALRTQKEIPGFTTQKTFTFVRSPAHQSRNMDERVVIFPDLDESIKDLDAKFKSAPPRIPYDPEAMRDEAFQTFHSRLRDPKMLGGRIIVAGSYRKGAAVNQSTGPAKNPMISTCVSMEMSKAKQSTLARAIGLEVKDGEAHIANERGYFTAAYLKRILDEFGSHETMILMLSKFFFSICGIRLNTTHVLSLGSPNEIAPNVQHSRRHAMIKNIGSYLAQVAGCADLTTIPRRVDAPACATESVAAILTIHEALLKSPLAQYCDPVAFSTQAVMKNDVYVDTLTKLWHAIKQKYPSVDIPYQLGSTLKALGTIGKLFSSNAFLSGGPSGAIDDAMALNSKEAFLCTFLVPMAISFDSVVDFAKDEIIARCQTR